MTITELIEKLSAIPEHMRDEMELQLFNTQDGSKFVIRDDVSQFSMMSGRINLLIKPGVIATQSDVTPRSTHNCGMGLEACTHIV